MKQKPNTRAQAQFSAQSIKYVCSKEVRSVTIFQTAFQGKVNRVEFEKPSGM